MSDDNDARRLEKHFHPLKVSASVYVSFATKVQLHYIPTLVSQTDLRRAISAAGFEALEAGGEAEDAEALARQKEIDEQRRLLTIGLILQFPSSLLPWQVTSVFPMAVSHSSWIEMDHGGIQALLVQFYVGWQYYALALTNHFATGQPIWMYLSPFGTSAVSSLHYQSLLDDCQGMFTLKLRL